MKKLVVGVADMAVSKDNEDVLITYALGSCIGVVIYDPICVVGGMLHYMLPDSKISQEKALSKPYMFANIGIPELFKSAYRLGAKRENLIVKMVGGASILKDNELFNIGKKNILIARKLFWKNNFMVKAHDVGGTISRTVELYMKTGECFVKTQDRGIKSI